MKKFKEKILQSVDEEWFRVALGAFICLISIFGALSSAPSKDYLIYASKFLTWSLSFLFGAILTYGIYFVIFLFGLSVVFSHKRIKVSLDITIFGLAFMILGMIILISNAQTTINGVYLTFSNFQQVFNNSLIETFPEVLTFSNSGVIGMFLVALINSGMTNIGSNVIGSILLVLGSFFAFAKIAIRFSKIIIDYYQQQFGRKTLEKDDSFEIAKDANYDTTAINAIKANREFKKQEEIKAEAFKEEALEVAKKTPSENSVQQSLYASNQFLNVNRIADNSQEGLVKATFNSNDNQIFEKQIEVTKEEMPTFESAEVKKEENLFPFANISDAFTIKQNKINVPLDTLDEIGSEEEIQPAVMESTQSDFEAPFFEERIEEEPIYEEPIIEERVEEETPFVETSPVKVESTRIVNVQPMKTSSFVKTNLDELANKKPVFENPNYDYSNKIEIKPKKANKFVYPTNELLDEPKTNFASEENIQVCEARKEKINQIFADLGVGAQIVSYTIGPSVTQYDVQTDKNVSINGLSKYVNDISVRLGGIDARFVPIVSGKSTSGIEIANAKVNTVYYKKCFDKLNEDNESSLTIPFGIDISGNYIAGDLRDFPHLLVCGTTGSGKSIFMHSVIMALIMRNSVEDLRLVMIDPKRVEFSKYKEIPHLLCPPINDSNKAYTALKKLVDLMEDRFTLFENVGVSNIKQYNQEAIENGRNKLPYIVLICDEFADLMDTNRKCSEPIVRIGQKARAAGIHMIIATQRPSTNVITGTIKANLPTRVALSCSSYIDSMTILGEGGAEKLLGNGDMLIMCSLFSKQGFTRVQGAYVDNKEIKRVCEFLKSNTEVEYDPTFLDLEERSKPMIDSAEQAAKIESAFDEKYEEVKKRVVNEEYTSISKIQRSFGFGFPRAGKIFAQLEQEGFIAKESEPNNSKGRKVLKRFVEVETQSENPGTIEQSTIDYSKRLDSDF